MELHEAGRERRRSSGVRKLLLEGEISAQRACSALPTKMVDRRRENMELFSYWYAKRRSLPNFDFSIGAIDIVISVEGC